MKNILLFIILLATSCNQNNQNSQSDSRQSDSLKGDNLNFVIERTALPVEPLKKFPALFVLDSIFNEDTAFNYSTSIYFPKSNDGELNKSLKRFIAHQIKLERPKNKTIDHTSFDMWVTDLNVSANFIHILFRQQSFTEGAAHYNHSYVTVNYDPIKKKSILFTDIFKFSKSKSKQAFCHKMNGYANGLDDSDGYNDGLNPKEINKDLNYGICGQQLIIYPNYCCAEEDKIFTIDLRLIQDYVNPILGKHYGLNTIETNH